MRFSIRFRMVVLACSVLLVALGVAGCTAPNPSQPLPESPVTVVLVRHAEKAAEPADDPPLTEAGRQRATLLARMASASGAQAVYATQFLRTQQTVEPLAAQRGIPVQRRDASDTGGLVAQIFAENRGQVVVVAGHSDTVPMLVEKLSGKPVPPIAETEYDNLYVVTSTSAGSGSTLRLRYGGSNTEAAAATK